ncbi:MAG TPA: hypothetical protein PL082_09450, partial [Tepidiformaceae bacterium]|nr:hypothetical protein [Tepidiformaceae bacterium]
MRGAAGFGSVVLAVLLAALLRAPIHAGADPELLDSGFETPPGESWQVQGAAASLVANPGSGNALEVTITGSPATVSQVVEGAPGQRFTG